MSGILQSLRQSLNGDITALFKGGAGVILPKFRESVRSALGSGSPLSLSTGVFVDIASISLPPGDWDLSGIMASVAGGTYTDIELFIGGTVAGDDSTGRIAGDNVVRFSYSVGIVISPGLSIANYQVKPTVTTTYYLKFRGTFGAGSPSVFGRISARPYR
jgi:hypothetical protein